MQNLADSTMQQATRNITASPLYSEDVSIWHHMSEALHQSLYRVLTLLIAVLPGILAFFVALLVFALAGMLISWVLRRCLTWAKFDLRVARKERHRLGSDQLTYRDCQHAPHSGSACCSVSSSAFRRSIRRMRRALRCPSRCCLI